MNVTRPRRRFRIGVRRLQRRLGKIGAQSVIPENTSVLLVAALIGVTAALGAYFLRELIFFFQRLSYGISSPAAVFIQALPWWQKVIIPAVGGLGVGLIVKYFAPETKGHGVPEVMEAVAVKGGFIRKRVAVAKAVASALTIGTGGSTGREGPIIQIGAALGSTLGRYVSLNPHRVKVFVGCGAAAGIASAFNAPVAGALFAAEVILADFTVPRLGPVVVASVSATAMTRALFGDERAFLLPNFDFRSVLEFLPYTLLGIVCGLASVVFIRTLYRVEDYFDESRIRPLLRPVVGGILVGGLSLATPFILGTGYEGITNVVLGKGVWYLFLALAAAKLLATSFTLGSGGSGGIFAPSLFLGACLGGALGDVTHRLLPGITAEPGAYAVVGMGGLVAGTTHAPITAILILFEMTGDYRIILPLMFTCVTSVFVSSRLHRDSVYTEKLSRRGVNLQGGREVNLLRTQRVGDVMHTSVEIVPGDQPMAQLTERVLESPHSQFFVEENGKLLGVIYATEIRQMVFDQTLNDLVIARDLVEPTALALHPDDTLDQAIRLFSQSSLDEIPVLDRQDRHHILGVVTHADCINAYNRAVAKMDAAGEIAFGSRMLGQVREIQISDRFRLIELEVPSSYLGKTLEELALPARHGVQVLLVRRRPRPEGAPDPIVPRADLVLRSGDRMLLGGAPEAIAPFRSP
jgi:CIC family chloride channel protein